MTLPALLAVGVAYVLYVSIDQSNAQSADQETANEMAANLVKLILTSGTMPDPRTIQAAMPNDQIIIVMDGHPVLSGPLPASVGQRQLELTAVSTFPGGNVTVRDFSSPGHSVPYQLIVAALVPVVLLTISAVAAASFLSRTLRRQIQHASSAAERVAAGDLTARMGSTSTGEFAPLADAFDGMAARLDSSERNQREFLGDLVHELATPVSAISATGLALADGTASTRKDRDEAAATLTRETERMQRLLADLRNLSHLDLAQRGSMGPVPLDQLCRDVVARHTPTARAAGVTLSSRGGKVTAVSDERLVAMVVDNFVANAIRYTPSGGEVRVEIRRQRGEAVIGVDDTGVGIDAEHRERIFDRFYRVDETRQRATGGSGLGLPLAERAAKQLEGRIELVTRRGEGSSFRLIFPLKPRSQGTSASDAE
jgi:signal transduction histidine kinase